MLAALETLRGEFSFEVEVIDVDSDPELVSRYDDLVPVLVSDGAEICHYFLDKPMVREILIRQMKTAT